MPPILPDARPVYLHSSVTQALYPPHLLVALLLGLCLGGGACAQNRTDATRTTVARPDPIYSEDLPRGPRPRLDLGQPPAPAPLPPNRRYVPGTYRSPVRHPIRVSGTFGELRADHFHMGLDIKSANQASGDALAVVADGFISRLRVSAAGYGNAVYVDHPNGTRSVYAHLDAFAPAIQAYLDSVHYAEETFELDVEPRPTRFRLRAGDALGTMGNTGSSQGPHLHFELRLAANDAAFNPLLYDLPVSDHRAPSLRGLSVYAVDDGGRAPRPLARLSLRGRGDRYTLDRTLTVPPGRVAFGLKAYDQQEGATNLNGVFRIVCRVDGATVWQTTFDTIAFEDTRYIQAEYDFGARASGQGYYYRLHRLPGNGLDLAEVAVDGGTVPVGFGESRAVEIEASDPFGNRSTLTFTLRGDTAAVAPAPPPPPYSFVVRPGAEAVLELGDARLLVPRGAVYADTYLPGEIRAPRVMGALSRCYDIGTDGEPLHRRIEVTLPTAAVPPALLERAYLGRCDRRGRAMDAGLSADGDYLIGELRDWAPFALYVDTVAPTVRALGSRTFALGDDVSGARALRYRVTQGGDWVLATYDAKSARLEVRADKRDGRPLRVEVWDEVGNRGVWLAE